MSVCAEGHWAIALGGVGRCTPVLQPVPGIFTGSEFEVWCGDAPPLGGWPTRVDARGIRLATLQVLPGTSASGHEHRTALLECAVIVKGDELHNYRRKCNLRDGAKARSTVTRRSK